MSDVGGNHTGGTAPSHDSHQEDAKEAIKRAEEQLNHAIRTKRDSISKIEAAKRELARLRSHMQANNFDLLLDARREDRG